MLSYMHRQYAHILQRTSPEKHADSAHAGDDLHSDSEDESSHDEEVDTPDENLSRNSDAHLHRQVQDKEDAPEDDNFLLRIATDEDGNLHHTNQVDDHLY